MKQATKPLLYCSFCYKSNREVKTLFESRYALICNECVGVCAEFIRETDKTKKIF
jgi:ATP-dependent Clp protease ATP-binding subunit ClpX